MSDANAVNEHLIISFTVAMPKLIANIEPETTPIY